MLCDTKGGNHVKKILTVFLILGLMLLCATASGENVLTEDRGLDLSCGSVHYPVVTLTGDEVLTQTVNDRILENGNIRNYMTRLPQLLSGGEMNVTWTAETAGDILSCVFSAEGALETRRNTHVWTTANVDLRTGEEIPFASLFTDEQAALELIGAILETEVAPELSAHLQNCELLPVPETFAISPAGLCLFWPVERLSTLSDRAGEIDLAWNEIAGVLDLTPGSIADRFGLPAMLELTEESSDRLTETAERGEIPGLPVKLGGSLKEATDRYHLLTDPDFYENGRMFAPEAAAFRNCWLLTDGLTEDWDTSLILGIRMDRGCLCGLCIGQTERSAWLEILGEPEAMLEWDEDRAEANRSVPGICDYYTVGGRQLKLLSDTDGILRSLILMQ